MRFATLFALAGMASAAAVTTTSKCNANNCLRQVRASAFTTRTPAADCAAFQTTTVPAATVTVGALTTPAPVVAPAAPTRPAYASSCDDDAEYRSACSCQGYFSTVVSSGTVTTTTLCSTVVLQATSGAYAGNYFRQSGVQFVDTANIALAEKMVYLNGKLYDPNTVGTDNERILNVYESSATDPNIAVDLAYKSNPTSYTALTCTIVPGTGSTTCTTPSGRDTFFTQGTTARIQFAAAAAAGTTAFGVKAVAACAAA